MTKSYFKNSLKSISGTNIVVNKYNIRFKATVPSLGTYKHISVTIINYVLCHINSVSNFV